MIYIYFGTLLIFVFVLKSCHFLKHVILNYWFWGFYICAFVREVFPIYNQHVNVLFFFVRHVCTIQSRKSIAANLIVVFSIRVAFPKVVRLIIGDRAAIAVVVTPSAATLHCL